MRWRPRDSGQRPGRTEEAHRRTHRGAGAFARSGRTSASRQKWTYGATKEHLTNVTETRDLDGLRPLPLSRTAQPSGALVSALTTEHYTLLSARSSTIIEANGRSSLFLSAVSGATVALALVAQLDKMGDTFRIFAFTILPTLLMLGFMSYARLADLAAHDAYYARAIGWIRGFYFRHRRR